MAEFDECVILPTPVQTAALTNGPTGPGRGIPLIVPGQTFGILGIVNGGSSNPVLASIFDATDQTAPPELINTVIVDAFDSTPANVTLNGGLNFESLFFNLIGSLTSGGTVGLGVSRFTGTTLNYIGSTHLFPMMLGNGNSASSGVSMGGSFDLTGAILDTSPPGSKFRFFLTQTAGSTVQIIGMNLGRTGSLAVTAGTPTIVAIQSTNVPFVLAANVSYAITSTSTRLYAIAGITLSVYSITEVPTLQSITLTLLATHAFNELPIGFADLELIAATGNLVHMVGHDNLVPSGTTFRYRLANFTNPVSPSILDSVLMFNLYDPNFFQRILFVGENVIAIQMQRTIQSLNYSDNASVYLQQVIDLGPSADPLVTNYADLALQGQTSDNQLVAYITAFGLSGGFTVGLQVNEVSCNIGYIFMTLSNCLDPFGEAQFCVPIDALDRAVQTNNVPMDIVPEAIQYNGAIVALRAQFTAGVTGWAGQTTNASYGQFQLTVRPPAAPTDISLFQVSYASANTFRLIELGTSRAVNSCTNATFLLDQLSFGLQNDDSCSICRWITDPVTQQISGMQMFRNSWGAFRNVFDRTVGLIHYMSVVSPSQPAMFIEPVVAIPNPFMASYFMITNIPANIVQCCMGVGSPTFLSACQLQGFNSPLNGPEGTGLCNDFMTNEWCPTRMDTDSNCSAFCQFTSTNCDLLISQFCTGIGGASALGTSTCACFMGPEFYLNFFTQLSQVVVGLNTGQQQNPICVYPPCSVNLAGGVVPFLAKQGAVTCPDIISCIQVGQIFNSGNFNASSVTISAAAQCGSYSLAPTASTGGGTGTFDTTAIILLVLGIVLLVVLVGLAIYLSVRKPPVPKGTAPPPPTPSTTTTTTPSPPVTSARVPPPSAPVPAPGSSAVPPQVSAGTSSSTSAGRAVNFSRLY